MSDECQRCGAVGGFGCYERAPEIKGADSDDLVKRLRSMLEGNLRPSPIGQKAADRIEELEAQLREARMQSLSNLGQADEAYQAQLAAEAKLEKAVSRLEKLSRWLDLDDEELAAVPIEELSTDHRHIQQQVNATLEELKDPTADS